jgi:hypothetical protein
MRKLWSPQKYGGYDNTEGKKNDSTHPHMIRHKSSHWPYYADGQAKRNRAASPLTQRFSETDSLSVRQQVQMQGRSTYNKNEGDCLKNRATIGQNDEHNLDQNTGLVMFRNEERNAELMKMWFTRWGTHS